ncbi:hypothetical protein LCGC14_0428910 [marine sediment metagenome]|uniref:Uncharacterized protein n=1 Tax=marine sediment metagenome TaxID=412755 RepID=A0A0F9VY16_9ZZZZ
MIKCPWCAKEWEWDWCLDEIIGAQSAEFVSSESVTKLLLYVCTCGGSLGVLTEEKNGSHLFTGTLEEV